MISDSKSTCPKCGGQLKYYDTVKRIVRTKYGVKNKVDIRRFRCQKCSAMHRELPDFIFPYKQYEAEIIIGVLEGFTGHISGLCTLSGKLTCFGSLSGKLSAVIDFNAYSGEYEVVPNAFNTQVLPTANKVLKKDIVVQKVPYFETSNNYDGVTVYIAEEVNQNA